MEKGPHSDYSRLHGAKELWGENHFPAGVAFVVVNESPPGLDPSGFPETKGLSGKLHGIGEVGLFLGPAQLVLHGAGLPRRHSSRSTTPRSPSRSDHTQSPLSSPARCRPFRGGSGPQSGGGWRALPPGRTPDRSAGGSRPPCSPWRGAGIPRLPHGPCPRPTSGASRPWVTRVCHRGKWPKGSRLSPGGEPWACGGL